jgi:hypothetical protein
MISESRRTDRRIPQCISVCYADSIAVRLTCRPHISLLRPADSKSSHCEQTDRHRRNFDIAEQEITESLTTPG